MSEFVWILKDFISEPTPEIAAVLLPKWQESPE